MDSLMYSLNATIPIFLVMVVGYILKQIGMLNDEFVKGANKFNFKITLPALLFQDILAADIVKNFDGEYVLFCAGTTIVCIAVVWFVSKLTYKSTDRGEFVQGCYRGSAAVLGAAFLLNIYGNTGMAPLMIIGSVPLYNMFAVIILTFETGAELDMKDKDEAEQERKNQIKKAFFNVLKNPIIISIAVGMLIACTGWQPPKMIGNTVGMLAKLASPLALVAIGAGFEGRKAIKRIPPTLVASFIKLVAQPMIFLPLAILLGFREEKLVALVIMFGAPSTPSGYIMAKNMGHEGVLSSSIIVMTTLLSAFSVTGILFLLKYMGYV